MNQHTIDELTAKAVANRMQPEAGLSFPGLLYSVMRSVTRSERDGNEGIRFERMDGRVFWLVHEQDCCESVNIESIVGDLSDLEGEPILLAEESTREATKAEAADSGTWTFYKFATRKGYVDIRFFGESNGYYSERVDFIQEDLRPEPTKSQMLREYAQANDLPIVELKLAPRPSPEDLA